MKNDFVVFGMEDRKITCKIRHTLLDELLKRIKEMEDKIFKG